MRVWAMAILAALVVSGCIAAPPPEAPAGVQEDRVPQRTAAPSRVEPEAQPAPAKTASSTTSRPPPAPTAAPAIVLAQDANVVTFDFTWKHKAEAVSWQFGDGTNSTEPAPMHTYAALGVYEVVLRVLGSGGVHVAKAVVEIEEVPYAPRVVVGVTDTGINPYHDVYYRPDAVAHPCTYVVGYDDCNVPALPLSVGPGHGTYSDRLAKDRAVWDSVRPRQWYWIPQTAFIAVHCPEPYDGAGLCILDDTQTHGTQTTSSVLSEAPDALLVFNEGSSSPYLADAPVAIDIESNSWGTVAPLYVGLVNGPTGAQLCHDSIDSPMSLKFRSAGNNGPVPNLGDCWRNGYRTYSVSGGYPDGSHGELSGSTPDFASYWCRPVAQPDSTDAWDDSCGTSFAAPTAAGTAAAALLELRRHLEYLGGSTATEVAPGVTHEAFMDAIVHAATYDPEARAGFPSGSLVGPATAQTPWLWWGWGWLDSQVVAQALACATGGACPDNKSAEAWAFNDARRAFVSDGEPL